MSLKSDDSAGNESGRSFPYSACLLGAWAPALHAVAFTLRNPLWILAELGLVLCCVPFTTTLIVLSRSDMKRGDRFIVDVIVLLNVGLWFYCLITILAGPIHMIIARGGR